MSAGNASSSASASKEMASEGQAPQASEKYKFGITNSIINVTNKVQFGTTNTIGNPATAVSAQPGNATVNQAANAFKAKISSRTRSELEEITRKRLANVVDDVLGVPAQSIDAKLIATVVRHLCEQYDGDVRERVYNEYEPTVSYWKTITESSLRTELKKEVLFKYTTEGTLEFEELADEVEAEREAVKADLRAEQIEEIQKELDEERPAMKASMKVEKEQEIRNEFRAEMGPSVRKALTEEFIKRLTEGLGTEPTDNTAGKEPSVAKQAEAAPSGLMNINDMLDTRDVQPQSSISLSNGKALAPDPSSLTNSVHVTSAPMDCAEHRLTPLEPPSTQSALGLVDPMHSTPVVLPSIETADPPAAADQSADTQSATAPVARGLSAYSSKATSSRASSRSSTSTGSKRSLEDDLDDDQEGPNKRARYVLSLQGYNEVWLSTIDEHLDDDRDLSRLPSPAGSERQMPNYDLVGFDRFQSLPAEPSWSEWRVMNPRTQRFFRRESSPDSVAPGFVDEGDDRATSENNEDTTLVGPSANAPSEMEVKTEDSAEVDMWLSELEAEL